MDRSLLNDALAAALADPVVLPASFHGKVEALVQRLAGVRLQQAFGDSAQVEVEFTRGGFGRNRVDIGVSSGNRYALVELKNRYSFDRGSDAALLGPVRCDVEKLQRCAGVLRENHGAVEVQTFAVLLVCHHSRAAEMPFRLAQAYAGRTARDRERVSAEAARAAVLEMALAADVDRHRGWMVEPDGGVRFVGERLAVECEVLAVGFG